MKLLFIYYKLFKPGGVANVLVSTANELVDRGYDVTILLLMAEHKSFYELDPRVKLVFIDSFDYWTFRICIFTKKHFRFIPKLQNINNYIYDFGVWLLVRKWVLKNHLKFNNIISCWYKISILLGFLPKINKKTIAWEHVNYEIGGIIYLGLRKRSYKNLKFIVSLNNAGFKYFLPYKNSKIIPNFINPIFETKNEIIFKNRLNRAIFVGRLDEGKNVLNLIQNFIESKLYDSWELAIIGGGPEKNRIEEYISRNNYHNKVLLLGEKTMTEIVEELDKSKLFLITSSVESFSIVIIEALSRGLPVISYNTPYGPSDIINNHVDGYIIGYKNNAEFIEVLNKIAENPGKLESMSQNAYEKSKKYTKNQIMPQWESLLKE